MCLSVISITYTNHFRLLTFSDRMRFEHLIADDINPAHKCISALLTAKYILIRSRLRADDYTS